MINDKPSSIGFKTAVSTAGSGVAGPPQAPAKEKVSNANSEPKQPAVEPKVETAPSIKSKQVVEKEPSAVSAQALAEARREEVKEKVSQAIPKVRELMQKNQRSLDFRVAEEENRVIITVIDKETDKVIRQIPPEDFLNLAASLEQEGGAVNTGSIFDSKA